MTTKITEKNISNIANAAVQWQSVVTADGSTSTTAEAGKGYPIDTTSAAHTINLPASPSAGDTVAILDYAGTFGTNSVTVGRNSSNIQGAAEDGTISTNRRAITFVYIDSTQGWIPANDNTTDDYGTLYVAATGGTVATSGDYKIHTFTSSGCFVVSCAGNTGGSNSVDYLVVAGGGGGGAKTSSGRYQNGGGGGAGGYRTNYPSPATGGLSVTTQTYPVTVGGGGAGGPSTPGGCFANDGVNGSDSIFSTITSAGGGHGAGDGDSPGYGSANTGGSGGGGLAYGPTVEIRTGASGNTPPVSPPQGNDGGNGGTNATNASGAGAGGGAGGAGGNASCTQGGAGGVGAPNSITGTAVSYAGGGGGAGGDGPDGNTASPCGTGGDGGHGADDSGDAGTTNRGGGGGGSGPGPAAGASGGSGIVIIRYKYQ